MAAVAAAATRPAATALAPSPSASVLQQLPSLAGPVVVWMSPVPATASTTAAATTSTPATIPNMIFQKGSSKGRGPYWPR